MYFRDGWKEKAIAISSARGNGKICSRTEVCIEQEIDIAGDTGVYIHARVKKEQPKWEMIENSIDDWREQHLYLSFGLECLPVVGTVADVYDSYKAFKEGDIKGGLLNAASAVVSKVGCIICTI